MTNRLVLVINGGSSSIKVALRRENTAGAIFEAIEPTSWPSSRSGSAALSDAMQAIALCRDAGEGVGA